MRNSLLRSGIAMLILGLSPFATGQNSPVVPNSWSNPDFQKRIIGSYGVRSEIEPDVMTRDEARFFNDDILPLVNAGNLAEATQLLQANVTAESNANFDYILGTLYLQQGNNPRALNAYRNAVKKFPEYLRAYKNMGIVYTQTGKFAEAIEMLTKSIELGESNGDTYGLLAYNYFNQGKYMQALDSYRLATILNPQNRDWVIGKAQSLMEVGDYREAQEVALQLLEDNPGDDRFWVTRANAYVGLEEFDMAIANLEMARNVGNLPTTALLLLGDLHLNNRVPRLALDAYLEAAPKLSTAQRLRILGTLVSQSLFDAANTFMEQAAPAAEAFDRWSTTDRQTWMVYKSQVAMGLGDEKSSIAFLEEVLEEDPFNGRALLQVASYYRRQSDTEKALYFYDRAVGLSDTDIRFEGLVQMATLHVGQRQYKEALKRVREALDIRSEERLVDYADTLERILERSGS
jgi:tetratricopeptide (TPR) repeat protein